MVRRAADPGSLDAVEKIGIDELRVLQLERLQKTLRHTFTNVAPFRAACEEKGVAPDDLRTLDDLRKFPFMVKDDLRKHYPFGLFAVPRRKVFSASVADAKARQRFKKTPAGIIDSSIRLVKIEAIVVVN